MQNQINDAKKELKNTVETKKEGVYTLQRQLEEDIDEIKKETAEDFTNLKRATEPAKTIEE